jgi:predicted transcriptional regulator
MEKTSVYLGDDERRRLEQLATIEHVSQAEVIRRAIREYRPTSSADRDLRLAGSFDGPGGSVADIDEHDLLEGFGE